MIRIGCKCGHEDHQKAFEPYADAPFYRCPKCHREFLFTGDLIKEGDPVIRSQSLPTCDEVREYLKNLTWTGGISDHEKGLVAGNIWGFLSWLKSRDQSGNDRG